MAIQLQSIAFPKRGQIIEDEFVSQWENGMDELQGAWTTNLNSISARVEQINTQLSELKPSVVTIASDAAAHLTYNNISGDYVLYMPRGDKGYTGSKGNRGEKPIISLRINASGNLEYDVTYADSEDTISFGSY